MHTLPLVVLGILVGACSLGQNQPTTQPAAPATRPTDPSPAAQPAASRPFAPPTTTRPDTPSSGDPKIDAILDRLEEKGRAIKGLACKLTYKFVTVEPVEDAQTKEGDLLYAVDQPNAKFLIHFDRLVAEGVAAERHEYFFFDGQWLIERNDKARTVIRRQIVRPGEQIDPFKLGKGPFPLPFGQKRDEILKNFKVNLEKYKIGDPINADHLRCVPLPNTELAARYSRVDIFVSRDLELPIRIVTERLTDGNRTEVDFKEINANEAPANSRFRIDTPEGFSVSEEPLPDRE